MNETFTLIIFEIVYESTDLFLIPNHLITDEIRQAFKEAAGKYSWEDIERIFQMLYPDLIEDPLDENIPDFSHFKQEDEFSFTLPITDVKMMGIVA